MKNTIKVIISFLIIVTFGNSRDIGYVKSFDGVDIKYEVVGEGSSTLVFIHGWCCDRTYWKYQSEYFSQNYTVVLIDLAGHGGSSLNRTEWSMEAYGQDIKSVVEALDLNNMILIGHSAGAFAAMAGAVLVEDKIICVIGVDGLRFSYDGYLEKHFDEEYIKKIADNYSEDFAQDIKLSVPRWFPDNADTNLINWVASDMCETSKEIAIPAAQAYYRYLNGGLQSALKQIGNKIPIIEINAIDRYEIAVDHVRNYAPLFSTVSMSGVGHFLMLEKSNEFNSILNDQIINITSGN